MSGCCVGTVCRLKMVLANWCLTGGNQGKVLTVCISEGNAVEASTLKI